MGAARRGDGGRRQPAAGGSPGRRSRRRGPRRVGCARRGRRPHAGLGVSQPTVAAPAPEFALLPESDHFARNLIGGRWVFPAAPYDFQVRNPLDSTETAVVPLSSRFDVDRAVEAADAAGPQWRAPQWRAERIRLVTRLV